MLEAMPLLGCSRAQARLELFHAPVTQCRAPTVQQELADLARPEQGKGMLSPIVSLQSRRAVPTPFLFPAPAAAGCSHSGSTICTHCFALGHRKGSVIHSHAGHRQMLLSPSAISSFNMSVPGVDVDMAPGAVFLPVRLGSVCRHSYNLGRQQHTAQACNECTVRR